MPSVMVVVDFSGSMASQIDMGTSRVEALGDVLFEPAGVIASNADVRFGLALVNATGDMLCPDIVTVGIGSELAELATAYADASPSGDSPMAEGVGAVASGLSPQNEILLILDGDPDSCVNPDEADWDGLGTRSPGATGRRNLAKKVPLGIDARSRA